MSGAPLKAAAQRVQDALAAKGLTLVVKQFPESTRSAVEAAAAIGCDVAQIAKSLIFRAVDSGRPVLVVASGANRVDEAKVSAVLGEQIGRADAAFAALEAHAADHRRGDRLQREVAAQIRLARAGARGPWPAGPRWGSSPSRRR